MCRPLPARWPLLISLACYGALLTRSHAAETSPTATDAAEIPAPAYVMLMMARDGAVQSELGLSAKQRQAVADTVARVDQPLWQLRDVPPARCGKQLDEQVSVLRQGLDGALTAAQLQRFDQLVMQARGARGLVAPDVSARLGLSRDQQASLQQLIQATDAGTLDSKRVLGLLKPEQAPKLTALFGPRFDLGRVTRVGCQAPELKSVEAWINSPPLTLTQLRGKVVVVHFWAFHCINCIHNLPHYSAWYEKFPKDELTILGLHTPETAAERQLAQLEENVRERGIEYPVAFDLAAENWKVWANNLWPSVYLIDRKGQVRSWWYGELNWQGAKGEESMRKNIEKLLAEKP